MKKALTRPTAKPLLPWTKDIFAQQKWKPFWGHPAFISSDPNFMDNITQGEDRLEDYALHELQNAYNAVLTPEKWVLRDENRFFWSDSALTTNT